ncbi:PI-1 pilus minor pilin RrgC, partial [Streptococcus canis]
LLVGGGLSVKAKDANNTLVIQLQDYQDVVKALGDKQPQQLKVWQLSGEFRQEPTKEVFDRLKSWDEDKLDVTFKQLALEMTFTSDHIEVTGIPNG